MNWTTVILLATAFSATASGNIFNWDDVPYTDLRGGGSVTSPDGNLNVAFSGNGWLQLETGGKVGYQPDGLDLEAVMAFQWSEPVINVSFDISGFVRNHFYEAVKVEFYLGDLSVSSQYLNLHSMEETGGWLSNVVQWSSDGAFSVATPNMADRAVVTLVTKADSGQPTPYWVNLQLSAISYATLSPIPEPAHGIWLLGLAVACYTLRLRRLRRATGSLHRPANSLA